MSNPEDEISWDFFKNYDPNGERYEEVDSNDESESDDDYDENDDIMEYLEDGRVFDKTVDGSAVLTDAWFATAKNISSDSIDFFCDYLHPYAPEEWLTEYEGMYRVLAAYAAYLLSDRKPNIALDIVDVIMKVDALVIGHAEDKDEKQGKVVRGIDSDGEIYTVPV